MSRPEPLRAPQQDGSVLARPPLAQVVPVLERNRRLLDRAGGTLLERPFAELRRQAREAAVEAAQAYLAAAGEPAPRAAAESLLLSGHQPELFHPGVWVKHFALNGLARAHGATALNLIVDNDTTHTTLLHVPSPEPHYRVASVPFDQWTEGAPYEERAVRDEGLFASLPDRVAGVLGNVPFRPLLPEFWEEVLRQRARTALLGERFAAARRALERQWGCHNLELPVSALCDTEPFAWFACHLLSDLPRFHALYNESVRAYRRAHDIRSRNHPVPDLAADGDWLEAPFWAWRAGQARRARLMARRAGNTVQLRADGAVEAALPLSAGASMTAVWRDLRAQGRKLRTRALTTTLFARLFLADLFMHGIGGGKYDELTDELIRGFYGIEPPAFLVLSATLLLPYPRPAHPPDCQRLRHELRDLRCNPQRHLPADVGAEARSLVDLRRAWVEKQPGDRRGRRERFGELKRLTEQLRPFAAVQEGEVTHALAECERAAQAAAVLRRRDYAFCLYSEATLRPFLTGFLDLTAAGARS